MTTTDELAFVDGILEQPDCDTRRLVYADWLQERGEEDRAELIRVQVELETYPEAAHVRARNYDARDGIDERLARCFELEKRESALLQSHPEWFPACPSCVGVGLYELCDRCHNAGRIGTFTRGVLESLTVPTLETVMCRQEYNQGFGHPWILTPWASSFVRDRERWPALREVRIADRVPWQNYKQTVYAWWERIVSGEHPLATITGPVFVEMWQQHPDPVGRWLEFNTPELAQSALGQAVWRVLLRLAGVSNG